MSPTPTAPPAAAPEIEKRISADCLKAMRREIEDVQGAEVFFVGRLDRDLIVEYVEAYAFGNKRAVPALMQYAHPGDVVLHNHPSGNLEPSSADIEIASALGDRGIGSYIVDNDCTHIRLVVKPIRPKEVAPIDLEKIRALLSPGGALERALEAYEYRPQQLEMAEAVARAMNEDAVTAIEAGTGTGKSMAYLLPALAWAIKNHEKVVVATHTINLQEQLIEKDIPLLRQALGLEFEAALVKGRNNYLCKRKAEHVRQNPDFLTEGAKRDQMESIQHWIKTTRDGSLADLPFTPDHDVWEQVMSESDNCLRTQCPFYQSCFFYTARRRAARAHLLIVNHHLLMADLALRAETDNYSQAAVLPPFHRVVFDEAHHLEEVATHYFGSRVSRAGLLFLLRRLAAPRTGSGLLHFISLKIHDGTYAMDAEQARQWMHTINVAVMDLHRELRDAVEEAAERTAMALDQIEGGALDQNVEIKQRVTEAFTSSPAWCEEVEPMLSALLKAGKAYVEALRRLHDAIHQTVEKETPETMSPILELRTAVLKLETHLGWIVRFLKGSEEDCRWIEYRRRGSGGRASVAFHSAPLDVADDLRERVLRRYRSVVMTSATLTVEREFDHFLSQIGATDPGRLSLAGSPSRDGRSSRRRRLETLLLDSPFDYDRQVYVGAPIDLPSPQEEPFGDALVEFLLRTLTISRGRGLVLFTSYRMLEETFAKAAPRLEAAGYACLKQGAAGRSLLTETFRRDVSSILFATSSFWEGVDVPGEALSCLVLARLPFSVPNEPILEARVERLKAQGIEPFEAFIVPRAVIRFRQGFGRLIRTRDDRGAVLVADRRVASAGYGIKFLNSLPTRKRTLAPQKEVIEGLARFFADESS